MSHSSKFYRKSLTFIVPILEMINQGIICSNIAKTLNIEKSHVFYYVSKAKENGFVEESMRSSFVEFKLTQAGKNFLDRYYKNNPSNPVCRLENLQLKALITQKPTIPVDWKKIEMRNWTQYSSEIDSVKVRLNIGKIPTLVILPSPVDGDNVYDLIVKTVEECIMAKLELYDRIGLKVGKLQVCSKPEWLVYDPIAKEFCKHNGQTTYQSLGKVNASKPRKIGEFEFYDPRALLDYMLMPHRLKDIETMVKKILEQINKETDA
jgi:predicted transcriptional regulator